jgi:hypothetical protein
MVSSSSKGMEDIFGESQGIANNINYTKEIPDIKKTDENAKVQSI